MRPEDPYGTSKVVGEDVAEMVVRKYDVSVVSIRLSWIQYSGEYECKTVDPSEEGVGNFWSYVDVRDIVSVVQAALETDVSGHEPILAAAAESDVGRPTVELGEVPDDCDLDGEESAMSTAKAQQLLDWKPVHSWRQGADEQIDEPDVQTLPTPAS